MLPAHLCWITLTLVVGANSLAAQAIADSTMSTVAPDTVGVRTSGTTSVDSIAPPASPAPRPAVVVEVSPAGAPAVDTVVARVCSSVPSGTAAPSIVRVVFRAQATDADRAFAAQRVGGTLARAGDGGEAYILLPTDAKVRIAASRLILLRSVFGVSRISCPG